MKEDECFKFKIGELLKVTETNRCFKVFSLSDGGIAGFIKGWPVDKYGHAHNPKFLKRYEGATSVFEGVDAL